MGILCSCCSNEGETDPYIRYPQANDFTCVKYDEEYQRAADKREEFWKEQAKELSWQKEPETVLTPGEGTELDKWFPDGEMNICYNAIDRHVDAEKGDNICFAYSSAQTKLVAKIDYDQVCQNVSKLAHVLKNKFSVAAGDQVFIYMPNIPMGILAVLTCSRLGAIHNVAYAGMPAKRLAERLDESEPKIIFTCSGGFVPLDASKRTEENPYTIIKYAPILEEAITMCTKCKKDTTRIIYQRPEAKGVLYDADFEEAEHYHDYKTFLEDDEWDEDDCDFFPSNTPLCVSYTSGATGQAKGIVRDHGGTCVALNYAMKNIFNVGEESVHFAACNMAWDIGHNFMVYGPLLRGAKTVIWEGDPLYPDPGVLWAVVEQHSVTNMYVNISTLRDVKKADYDGELIKNSDCSSMKTLCLVGERGDPDTVNWLHQHLPDVIINDTYFTTETAWPICGQLCDLETYETVFPTLPGSVTRPVPSFEVKIMDEEGKECEPGKAAPVEGEKASVGGIGKVCIKRPLPPGSLIDIIGTNKDEALKSYFSDVEGYFSTGDSGLIDENGYLKIVGRTEDLITLQSGDKVPTQAFEDSINERVEVAESAVVAFASKERGDAPLAFVVLRGPPYDEEKLTLEKPESETQEEERLASRQIRKNVNTDCGENARLVGVIFVSQLPKTRSGQVLRKALREIAAGGPAGPDDHIYAADADVVAQVKEAFDKWSEPTAESALSEKEGKNRGCC